MTNTQLSTSVSSPRSANNLQDLCSLAMGIGVGFLATSSTLADSLNIQSPGVLWRAPVGERITHVAATSPNPKAGIENFVVVTADSTGKTTVRSNGEQSQLNGYPRALSHDGKLLAVSINNSIVVYDLATRETVQLENQFPSFVEHRALFVESINGKITVVGESQSVGNWTDHTPFVWNPGSEVRHFNLGWRAFDSWETGGKNVSLMVQSMSASGELAVMAVSAFSNWKALTGNVADPKLELNRLGPALSYVSAISPNGQIIAGTDLNSTNLITYEIPSRETTRIELPTPNTNLSGTPYCTANCVTDSGFAVVRHGTIINGADRKALSVAEPYEGTFTFNDYLKSKGLEAEAAQIGNASKIDALETNSHRFLVTDSGILSLGLIPGILHTRLENGTLNLYWSGSRAELQFDNHLHEPHWWEKSWSTVPKESVTEENGVYQYSAPTDTAQGFYILNQKLRY